MVGIGTNHRWRKLTHKMAYSNWSSSMTVEANFPKPVFTPYVTENDSLVIKCKKKK